jgi:hypothetical protein
MGFPAFGQGLVRDAVEIPHYAHRGKILDTPSLKINRLTGGM